MKALILTTALTTAFGIASVSAAPFDTVTENKLVAVCKVIQSVDKDFCQGYIRARVMISVFNSSSNTPMKPSC